MLFDFNVNLRSFKPVKKPVIFNDESIGKRFHWSVVGVSQFKSLMLSCNIVHSALCLSRTAKNVSQTNDCLLCFRPPLQLGPPKLPRKVLPYVPSRKGQYRPIVIDGCNIGFQYARNDRFSAEGLRITYTYFHKMGYEDNNIVIILKHIPQHYLSDYDTSIIDFYDKLGVLHWCPSRIAGKRSA